MRALMAAREVDAPDWLISAGAVRTAVWDHLHGHPQRTPLADIDLGFYDPRDLSEDRQLEIRGALEAALPNETWDIKNQAAVHLWYSKKFGYEVESLSSTAAAVATFPEIAVCGGLPEAFQQAGHGPLARSYRRTGDLAAFDPSRSVERPQPVPRPYSTVGRPMTDV